MFHVAFVTCLFALTLAGGQATEPGAAIGQISGRVLDDATYQPLVDTRVFLYPVPFPAGGRAPLAITNQNGEYVFTALKPGSYRLGTNKLGFFPTPGVGMPLVNVAEGEGRWSIDLTMSRGAVLAGRVLDQSGKPLRNIWVGALRLEGIARLDQAVPSVVVDRTNDFGEFRVQSLPPGQYVVVANRTSGRIGAAANGVTDSMTYFPGTLDLLSAQLVNVGLGETLGGLDVKMMTAPTFEVSGFAVDEVGRPISGALVALEADWPLFGGPKGSSWTDAEGRFQIGFIAAGDYKLTVTPPGMEPQSVTRQTPFVRVTVIDADVSGLAIQVPIR